MQDKAVRSTQAEADELAARKDKANALLAEAEAEAGKLKGQTDDLRAQAEAKLKELSLDKDTLEKVLAPSLSVLRYLRLPAHASLCRLFPTQ